MSGYAGYPEYRDSGVEWIGDIPRGWNIQRQKYVFNTLESGVSVNAADVSAEAGEVGVLKTSCVYTRRFRAEENKTVVPGEVHRVSCPVVPESIIVSRMNTPDLVGAAAYVEMEHDNLYLPDRLWQTTTRDDSRYHTKYFWYAMYLQGFRDQISNAAEGASSSMQNITQEDFLGICNCVPSNAEQQKIANFLDHETAKIDTLIEKQQALVKLLKEKRQAVISHAVTKGLNSDAPMKDSGVEWLGEVPVGWAVLQLRRAIVKIEQGKSPECESRPAEHNEWGVMKSGCVNYGVFDENANKALPSSRVAFVEFEIRVGDVLMSRASGSVDLIGSVALVGSVKPKLLMSDKVFRIVIGSKITPKYFTLLMGSNYIRSLVVISISGAEGMANNIGKASILSFKLPVPPLDQQQTIVNFLENLLSKIDILEKKGMAGIHLLKERRTALISAAVTGKIDVRNWQPPVS